MIFAETLKQVNGEEVESLQLNARKKDEDSNEIATSCNNRTKYREIIEKCLPSENNKTDDLELEVSDNDETEEPLFDELLELDDSLIPKLRHRKKAKQTKKIDEQEDAKKKELIKTVTRGDIEKIRSIMWNFYREGGTESSFSQFINQRVDGYSNTLLHIAARNKQVAVVDFLLVMKADPCLKNKYLQTPYTCTKCQKVKEVLINFARNRPLAYNYYENAKIPVDPDKNKEAEDVKKSMRKIMRQKAEKQEKGMENLKKEKKKALTAKRKFQAGTVPVRCTYCTDDIVVQEPADYTQYLFCSKNCLKNYRIKHPVVLR